MTMSDGSHASTASPVIPVVDTSAPAIRRLRRRAVSNITSMGHCAPSVMQTLLDESAVHAEGLIKAAGGLPGGIGNTGDECGGITAPLMLLGLRHASDPLDRGVPVVIYKGRALLQRFVACERTPLCREIRGTDRLPLRCVGVVCDAAEMYCRTLAEDSTRAIPEESRQAISRLVKHFRDEHDFHCARQVLKDPSNPSNSSNLSNLSNLLKAVSGFAGGTVFTGRTCGALTAGVVALGAAISGIEHNRLRVLRMLGLMAVGGDAFADDRNAFNKPMNLGHQLSCWFRDEFGSTQCRTITGCDVSTPDGVEAYIARGQITRCRQIAAEVAARVAAMVGTPA